MMGQKAWRRLVGVFGVGAGLLTALPSYAGFDFEPYYSVGSTKKITPNQKKGTETETITQREEKGIRAGLSFYDLVKVSLSVGQSYHVATSTTGAIKDEYEQIDFTKEIDSSTTGQQQKKKETQNRLGFSFGLDPSFSIFILRAKIGLTGTQRIVKLYSDDILLSTVEPAPTFKPHAGLGFGVRISPSMYFVGEYGFYFYKFPEQKPFERSLTVSYGFSI